MRRTLVLATVVAVATTLGITSAGAQGDSTKQFCDANWKISSVFNTLPEDPTDAQLEKIDAKLAPLLDKAETTAPAEISTQVTEAVTSLRNGIAAAFEDSTVLEEAGPAIDAYAYDNCGYQTVDVTATEYKFSGIPKKGLKPGRTIFRMTNEGAELHELGLGFIKTKTPIDKLLANEKRANKEVEQLGGTFALQGDSGYAYQQLKKGRWAAVCFIPVGSVDPNTEVEGPPHVTEGMVQEFKVA